MARNLILLIFSVAFYAWGELKYVPLILGAIVFNWFMGLAVGSAPTKWRAQLWLTIGLAGDLAVLGYMKYARFTIENLNAAHTWSGVEGLALPDFLLPLGVSFFTFHAISYLIDIYRGSAPPERNLVVYALYILLFPQLVAGPIVHWKQIAKQFRTREEAWSDFAWGANRFIIGLAKKMLIANPLGRVADTIFALPVEQLSPPIAWLGIACYTLQIYFDFSGYSDMAIGLMRMFGFRILENFNYPYIARSVREFWQRWHISLSTFFRDYVHVPLGGNRVSTVRSPAISRAEVRPKPSGQCAPCERMDRRPGGQGARDRCHDRPGEQPASLCGVGDHAS